MKTTKEKAEIMLAFDRWEKVEWMSYKYKMWGNLVDRYTPWNWEHNDYRIAEKPKEKIKMLCWTNGNSLFWREPNSTIPEDWTRFPAGDLEGEVGE